MPVQFYSLPWHIGHSEFAHYGQVPIQSSIAAAGEIATQQTREEAKADQSGRVKETQETQLQEIQGEERGAHGHNLGEKKEEKEEKKEPPPPTDPSGKGQALDIQA